MCSMVWSGATSRRSSARSNGRRRTIASPAPTACRRTSTFRASTSCKLRVSHGTAGLRPPFSRAVRDVAISGGVPEKVTLGNSDLKPAFSRETEYGFKMNFLRNYNLEYSVLREADDG